MIKCGVGIVICRTHVRENYSFDYNLGNGDENKITGTIDIISGINQGSASDVQKLLRIITKNPQITQKQIQEELKVSLRTVKRLMAGLQEAGRIVRVGNNRSGEWHLKNENERV